MTDKTRPPARFGGRIRERKGRKFPPELLSRDEVESLLRGCSIRHPTGIRNRALIVVLYRTGLRINEALSVVPKDVDMVRSELLVMHGKGERSRRLALDSASLDATGRWLDRRQSLGLDARSPVFCTLKGGPISAVYVRNLLARLADKAGIEKRVVPHGLRHTFAAELCREGVPVNVISKALGHASVATTSVYLDHIAPETVIATMKGRRW